MTQPNTSLATIYTVVSNNDSSSNTFVPPRQDQASLRQVDAGILFDMEEPKHSLKVINTN
jgi:hypothetical protein